MKPAPFAYFAPRELGEAVELLAQHGDEAKVIAGGQSLVPMMAFRLATPSVLVDINRIAALEYARIEPDTLELGALARHRSVQDLPGLRERCPVVAEGVDLIGHPAIRNRGTVGGSLAHADPAAEWPALLLALDGSVEAVGPGGTRPIPSSELFESYFTTSLAADEILTGVRLPLPNGGPVGSAFMEFARRHGDFALAGVAALLRLSMDRPSMYGTVEDVRLALIGVRDTAIRATAAEAVLQGREPTDEALTEAAGAVDQQIEPVSDVHGSSEYRRHLARVLTRRAFALARERAVRA